MTEGRGKDTHDGDAGADKQRDLREDDKLAGSGGGGRDTPTKDPVRLEGGHGDDTLSGGAGDDTLSGGNGDDVLDGGAGDDKLSGGHGDDTLSGGAGDDALSGGNDDDVLDGGEGNDTLSGDHGDDTLSGGAGDDELSGGNGDDVLDGGAGDDALSGGHGDDTLSGGVGDDTLSGGTGQDTFVFASGSGDDVVTDFDLGDDDKDGFTNDRFDVSELSGGSGKGGAVTAWDVKVTDDGGGNARLIFPEGESVVLKGVAPSQISSPSQLYAAGIPCFTPGTRILTGAGYVPVEHLRPGDRVQTADDGLRPILWIGRRDLGRAQLAAAPHLAPVRIAPGTLCNAVPLVVSPQHRFRLAGADLRARTGEAEAFVKARLLAERPGTRVLSETRHVSYIHLLTERHQVILAEGIWTESLHPGPFALSGLDAAARAELFALFPALRMLLRLPPAAARAALPVVYGPLARPELRRRDLGALGLGAGWSTMARPPPHPPG